MGEYFFIKGFFVGLWVAAPVGPVGALCIRRTLLCGRWSGLATGLGAATADCFYGVVAAYGLASISLVLIKYQELVRLIGGLLLLYIGVKTFFSNMRQKIVIHKEQSLLADYFSTVFLTLANPLTIVAFVALFTGLGVGGLRAGFLGATFMVLGVISGSVLWAVVLSFGLDSFRANFNSLVLKVVNLISGLIIVGFAVSMLIGVFEFLFE